MNSSKKSRTGRRIIEVIIAAAAIITIAYLGAWACAKNIADSSVFNRESRVAAAAVIDNNSGSATFEEAPQTESARYSFASIQGSSILKLAPGTSASEKIRFYNVDGNRTTYISLSVSDAPQGWEVEADSDIVAVPTGLTPEPVNNPENGTECIRVADRGYTTAEVAGITISVPGDVSAGTTASITITATAQWPGQAGQAAISQTRNFHIDVEISTAQ